MHKYVQSDLSAQLGPDNTHTIQDEHQQIRSGPAHCLLFSSCCRLLLLVSYISADSLIAWPKHCL